jgi:hypothetical protein
LDRAVVLHPFIPGPEKGLDKKGIRLKRPAASEVAADFTSAVFKPHAKGVRLPKEKQPSGGSEDPARGREMEKQNARTDKSGHFFYCPESVISYQ